MASKLTVEQWRRAIFRSTTLTDAAKVQLLFMADSMRADMTYSRPRADLAAALGKSERKISQRMAEAHEKGFLDTVVRGQKHRTAVYAALVPNRSQGDGLLHPEKRQNRHPENGHMGPQRDPWGPTSSRADLPRVGYGGDVGTYEEHDGGPAFAASVRSSR